MSIDWNDELAEQLDSHWRSQLRPRLDGLTDEEYFWEPVPGMWSIRPRGASAAPVPVGGGAFLHINREALHHGAEIALLRDLFRWRPAPA